MECLTDIIGITESNCPCILDGLTEEQKALLKVSKSGLYLDNLEGAPTMSAITMLDACQNYAQLALEARSNAVKKIYADMLAALAVKYKTGKGAFIGNIGRPSYAGTLNVSKRYQFIKIKPIEQSDAVVKVTGLRLVLDRDALVPVKILSAPVGGNQGTEVLAADLQAVANTYVALPIPPTGLSLPLSANGEQLEYYVVWDRGIAGLANPRDLKLDCNCGFKGNGFSDFVKANGGELDDINMLSTGTSDQYSHGITMDVDIRCVPGNMICREYDNENAIAVTMAWAVMYKAGELLIESILGSREVNRYTMMNREALYGKRSHFKKEYETRIVYLASVIDVSSSDCYICREATMFMAGIQS